MRIIVGIGLTVVALWLLHVAIDHYRLALTDFEPCPGGVILQYPEETGINGLEAVSLRSTDGKRLAAWYVPSRNGAAVVLAHGTNADRSSMLPEMRILTAAGFGVLAFDWPGDGGSEGEVHWGEGERQALIAAVSWVSARPDVNPAKIGGLGFSMGGYVMAQVAALDPQLAAVVLEATPSDFAQYLRWTHRRWGWLSQRSAEWAIRGKWIPMGTIEPDMVVGAIAPRPVLIIVGDSDAVIPEAMTRQLYASAALPKELWVVAGAAHGGYAKAAAVEYPRRLVQFFSRLLN